MKLHMYFLNLKRTIFLHKVGPFFLRGKALRYNPIYFFVHTVTRPVKYKQLLEMTLNLSQQKSCYFENSFNSVTLAMQFCGQK